MTNFAMKLPVGYRFCPTDEELVEHYLKKKVFHMPFPASIIPDFDVFLTDPWALPGDLKEKRFFFSKQKNFLKRRAGSGVWKSTGRDKFIFNSGINQVFGMRKSLVFSQNNSSNKTKTTTRCRWVMFEYRLASYAPIPNSTQSGKIEVGDWAIYCLFQKRRRPKNKRHGNENGIVSEAEENPKLKVRKASVLDLMLETEDSSSSSCSCSSEITQISCNGTESRDQEESSVFPLHSQSHVTQM